MQSDREVERVPLPVPAGEPGRIRPDHHIHVTFNDGSAKTIDFRGWLKGPIFEPLHDIDQFKKFFVAGSTIARPNGADMAPVRRSAPEGPPDPGGLPAPSAHAEVIAGVRRELEEYR
jgi:hypothetical protein